MMKPIRDLTAKQFSSAMLHHGWTRAAWGMGYYLRDDYSMSALNYPTHRKALAAFIAKGHEQDAKKGVSP